MIFYSRSTTEIKKFSFAIAVWCKLSFCVEIAERQLNRTVIILALCY